MKEQLIFIENSRVGEIQAVLLSDNRLWIVRKVDHRNLEDNPYKVKQRINPYNAGVNDYLLSDISQIKYFTNESFVNIRIRRKKIEIRFNELKEANEFAEFLAGNTALPLKEKKQSKIITNIDSILYILVTIFFVIDFQTSNGEKLQKELIEAISRNGETKGIKFYIFLHDTFGYNGVIIIGLVIVTYFVYKIYKRTRKNEYYIIYKKS